MNRKRIMNSKTILSLALLIACIPCYSECLVTRDVIMDYLTMAKMYQNAQKNTLALDYIKMIEPYAKFDNDIIYEKAAILKDLNRLTQSERELNKLIGLNQDYACSKLAKNLDEYNGRSLCYGAK